MKKEECQRSIATVKMGQSSSKIDQKKKKNLVKRLTMKTPRRRDASVQSCGHMQKKKGQTLKLYLCSWDLFFLSILIQLPPLDNL